MSTPVFGVMHDFRQLLPWRIPVADYYAECLDLIAEAENLGYESVWLSEHHGTADGFLPSPLVAAAAIAARTSRIRIGTNVLLLPLHHPIRVAEDVAVADLVSGGRMMLGVGQGYAPEEFELLGIDRRHRPSRFEEGIQIIRTALRDGRTGLNGRRFRIPDGRFALISEMPIHIGATGGPALDRAVRLGDGLLSYVAEPGQLHQRYADYHAALERAGRPPATFPFSWTSICHVAADAETAWSEAAPGIAYLESALRRDALTADDLDPTEYLVGSPVDVARRLVEAHERSPFDRFAFWSRLPGLTRAQASAAQARFAAEVVPRFSAHR
ncbi:MAG TPA: LLM class flavin-dependent oxidoreductase [Mycobacteriales bacterium]|nr:LLM class flavin-dependent oxidoreductase [Mycobacteriales bacterium]